MALDISQDTGYQAPIGLGPTTTKKDELAELLQPNYTMPAFPAGGSQIPWQNIFTPPAGQAQAAIGLGPRPNYGQLGWGPKQDKEQKKTKWTDYGQLGWGPPPQNNGPSRPLQNFGQLGYGQTARQAMVQPGAGQPGPGPQPGVTGMFPGVVENGVSLDNWLDPISGTWQSEFGNQSVIPLTEEQLNDPEFMKNWYLTQSTTIGQAEDMPGPQLPQDEYAQLYEEWLASFKPEEMAETPPPPGGPQVIYEYPYIPTTWGSGGSKGGSGYKNFFKALYWRVGE